MSPKRKIAVAGGIFLLLSLLLVCLLAGAYFYLPRYLETKIIPQLAADAGITDFTVNIRNIGFHGADLADLRLGSPENPALFVRSVQIDYSPRSIFRRKIDTITLNGIDLHAELAPGKFKLRGIDIEKLAAAQRGKKTAAIAGDRSPPVTLTRLQIRDSLIIIRRQARQFRIPVELDILPRDSTYNVLEVAAVMHPRGEKVTASAKIDRIRQRGALNFDSAALNLDRFADLIDAGKDRMLSGEMALHGTADIMWEPLRLSSIKASLTLANAKIGVGELQFQNPTDDAGKTAPFRIDLTAAGEHEWRFTGSRISMVAPLSLILDEFGGTLKWNAATIDGSGHFKVVLPLSPPAAQHRMQLEFLDPVALRGRISARYNRSGKWQCEVSNQQPDPSSTATVRLKAEPYTITTSIPKFRISAEGDPEAVVAAYELSAPAVRVSSGAETIDITKAAIKGTAKVENMDTGAVLVAYELQAIDSSLKLKDGHIRISRVAVSGKLNRDDVRQIMAGGVLRFSAADGRFPRAGIRIDSVRGKVPFRWPAKGQTVSGSIAVAGLNYKGLKLGRLTSRVQQTATGYEFEGRHQSTLLPKMTLNFSGETIFGADGPARAVIRFTALRPADAPEIDLGTFYPAAKGALLKGKFELDGKFMLNRDGLSGQIKTDFTNGYLVFHKNNLILDGMRLSINFPELPRIRTSPGQQIHFSKISLGDFVARNGRIDFQIETAGSLLIEKIRFAWCDGKVESQSVRLSPEAEEYYVTFYCDRLNLAKVLEQFGAAVAKGRGSVNGRIPLHYVNGNIRFDDGFLFSTPGEGGKISLSNTALLTAGIPPNTPQYVQMELAREALKDYDYSWAKLNITSEGEALLLQMQMDGKPARTLPFVYKKEIGSFMKVEADAKGSKFQGIRLDVNFRLPLNKFLQYKDLTNMIRQRLGPN